MALPFHKLLDALGGGLGSQARAILAAYGTDAHIYLPGIGTLNGYTMGNWLDSGGTTPATVDNPVGLVQDAIGSIHVSQGTTANKPILRKPANNYYWEFDGTNDNLASTNAPFQQADDQCVIAGASRPTTVGEKYIVSVRRQASTNPIAAVLTMNSGGIVRALWRNDAGTLISVYPDASFVAGTPLVVSARKVGDNKVCRVNGVAGAVNSTPIGATSTFDLMYVGDLSGANYFDGRIYPIIAIKGTVSDADLLILERWVGTLTGPTGVAI